MPCFGEFFFWWEDFGQRYRDFCHPTTNYYSCKSSQFWFRKQACNQENGFGEAHLHSACCYIFFCRHFGIIGHWTFGDSFNDLLKSGQVLVMHAHAPTTSTHVWFVVIIWHWWEVGPLTTKKLVRPFIYLTWSLTHASSSTGAARGAWFSQDGPWISSRPSCQGL